MSKTTATTESDADAPAVGGRFLAQQNQLPSTVALYAVTILLASLYVFVANVRIYASLDFGDTFGMWVHHKAFQLLVLEMVLSPLLAAGAWGVLIGSSWGRWLILTVALAYVGGAFVITEFFVGFLVHPRVTVVPLLILLSVLIILYSPRANHYFAASDGPRTPRQRPTGDLTAYEVWLFDVQQQLADADTQQVPVLPAEVALADRAVAAGLVAWRITPQEGCNGVIGAVEV